MNRIVFSALAVLATLVGVALTGDDVIGEQTAYGCHGAQAASCAGDYAAESGCAGHHREGFFARWRQRRQGRIARREARRAAAYGCAGVAAYDCAGPAEYAPPAPPTNAQPAAYCPHCQR